MSASSLRLLSPSRSIPSVLRLSPFQLIGTLPSLPSVSNISLFPSSIRHTFLARAMSSSRPAALLVGKLKQCHKQWSEIAPFADLVELDTTNRQDFLDKLRAGRFDNVRAIYRTFESIALTGRFDAEVIEALPKSVRFISHNGAGYDQVDVHACTARDPPIRVSNVLGAADDSTADTNMFLILGALRLFAPYMLSIREGKWRKHPEAALGHNPQGKVLGIVGMGGIGRNVMRKAQAFGMKVIYHNRSRLPSELEGEATYVTMDELLAQSDVISMNLPLNANTRHTLSDKEFAKMKDGVVIVNTARGAVIDEAALVRALDSRKVMSCGLDVFENEPKIHPGLINHPRALLLPHLGTSTYETDAGMEAYAISNVRSALETGKLRNIVPEQTHLGLGDD